MTSPDRPNRMSDLSFALAVLATVLLPLVPLGSVMIAGLTAMATTYCSEAERVHEICTPQGFWWATEGMLWLGSGGFVITLLGAWVWPRRARWAWIAAGYAIAFGAICMSLTISGDAP